MLLIANLEIDQKNARPGPAAARGSKWLAIEQGLLSCNMFAGGEATPHDVILRAQGHMFLAHARQVK